MQAGALPLGGGAPVAVQSMTNTDTRDAAATLDQIRRLAQAGCELVRVAVPDAEAADALGAICSGSPLPVVADIHFDYRLALAALKAGVAKLRLNPGNIGSAERVRLVAAEASSRGVPIRIGVNAGSLGKALLARYGRATPEAMAESALAHAAILESCRFSDIVISIKASDVRETVEACRIVARQTAYPLHLGITEAGDACAGAIYSAVGIGALLLEGIGDTVRVSLTAPPEQEIAAAFTILAAAGVRRRGPRFVSCPTCGRTTVDLVAIAAQVKQALADIAAPIRIAIMGCEVNGPGEASDADIGLACGKSASLVFRQGRKPLRISNTNLADTFVEQVRAFLDETAGPTGATASAEPRE